MDLEARISPYRDGAEISAGNAITLTGTEQPGLKRLLIGGTMKLSPDVAPGQYVLRLVVNDKLAAAKYGTAEQWMDFEVR